jgi:predicted Ser/Thr protein kinase
MNYYKFKTYNTSYYFPDISAETKFLYNLFSPYSYKAKIYWFLWKKTILKYQNRVYPDKEGTFFNLIKEIEPESSVMSYCLGTPGMEQKISMLGYKEDTKTPFFAKFSQKEKAKELTSNEIRILKELKNTNMVPVLYKEIISPSYIFLETEYISGKKMKNVKINNAILDLLYKINAIKVNADCMDTKLRVSLSHGDFCPWNILKTKNGLRIIDWEMAKVRPIGYDLFTYVFQTHFLIIPKYSIEQIFLKNKSCIDTYFKALDIHDYKDYLCFFAAKKVKYEKNKNGGLLPFYTKLYDFAKKI